ncbi:DUF1156 domain-containing protein [soil metagenome]|nr:DUF1156 domain-containing protein [Gemmatimonadota bacterium]
MATKPELFIERWLPVDMIGAESMRERGASSALPPLYFLHVWWARRPLTTSRAAILGSVLPAWSPDWPAELREKFPTEASYHTWFLELCGIFGDPVAGRKLIAWANERGIRLKGGPYSHKRAFTVSPSADYLQTMGDLLEYTWGERRLSVLDSFAGGGSIPFEALRYGFETYANELNPVASVILKATLDYPARIGPGLAEDIRKYGKILADRVRQRLEQFFPVQRGESIHAYIWARTVACPYTGKPIPLSPNWWLRKGSDPVAVRPIFDPREDVPRFEIVEGKAAVARLNPDAGTVRRGNGVSPWAANQSVDGDYIKSEAQAGRMGQILYTVGVKQPGGFVFRAPTEGDIRAVRAAEAELCRRLPDWESIGLLPDEELSPVSNYDRGHRLYGIFTWRDMFAPRQLLALGTVVEAYHKVRQEIQAEHDSDRGTAIATYLALAIDKAVDYGSRSCRWDTTRLKIVNTFDKHGYSFKWSYGEFDFARNALPWVISQVEDAYSGIARLAAGESGLIDRFTPAAPARVLNGSATRLTTFPDRAVDTVVVDPPYYDNVMYAECSDYFYVWLKRTLGGIHPELFSDGLTNKDDEAVANIARFEPLGRKKRDFARSDYERKLEAAFREMHRLLTDRGVLTVMFTHKQVEAWDTLARSLIAAGFAIHSSWPVHTESEHSTHQAKKNAARSTILLTCRKRAPASEPVWWDDIKGRVRQVARQKAAEFEQQGIRGVDLYIATFGPTLAILSESWPVLTSEMDERTGEPKPLRPEVALDLAREEVVALRKQGLLLGRTVQFDPYTDWYLMAWDAFRAEEFPGDEARKLALALGLDLERQVIAEKRLVAKKGQSVVLLQPGARRRRGLVDPDRTRFEHLVDAVHTAMLLYEEDGSLACEAFLRRTALRNDPDFKACLQAMLNAIPRTRRQGVFVRPEARTLEAMRLAFFDDLVVPPEEEPQVEELQLALTGGGAEGDEEYDEDDDLDEEEGEE